MRTGWTQGASLDLILDGTRLCGSKQSCNKWLPAGTDDTVDQSIQRRFSWSTRTDTLARLPLVEGRFVFVPGVRRPAIRMDDRSLFYISLDKPQLHKVFGGGVSHLGAAWREDDWRVYVTVWVF